MKHVHFYNKREKQISFFDQFSKNKRKLEIWKLVIPRDTSLVYDIRQHIFSFNTA